jgi:hypothetical protein
MINIVIDSKETYLYNLVRPVENITNNQEGIMGHGEVFPISIFKKILFWGWSTGLLGFIGMIAFFTLLR